MEYTTPNIRFKYYGHNIELLVEKALDIADAEEQESAVIYIARQMRGLHNEWSKNNINEELLIQHIETLSDGKLTCDLEKVQKHDLFEMNRKERSGRRSGGYYGGKDPRRSGKPQNRQNKQQNRSRP